MSEEFAREILRFHANRGENLRVPYIGGKELDIQMLYKEVITRGGFQQVSNNKQWKEIVKALNVPSSCTSASTTLRQHYYKILFPYEQEFFFGKPHPVIAPSQPEHTTPKSTKKIKINAPLIANTRRMILAFESKVPQEVNWALNTLMIFTCNTAHNFVLEQNGLIESIVNYLKYLYEQFNEEREILLPPVKRMRFETHCKLPEGIILEYISSILVIFRNLSMIRSNEIIMYRCAGMIDIIVQIFHQLINKEITVNCLEIITNLSKHIFLKDLTLNKELLCTLLDCMEHDQAEQAIECFRKLTLPVGNEEILESMPQEFFDELARWLTSFTSCKDAALEILCTLSDQKLSTRVKIAKAKRCLSGLVGLLTSSSQSDEIEDKHAKMSALILSNLSGAPSICKLFLPYESHIFMVAGVDERLSGFLANVLYEIQDLRPTLD
jgi:hypothetical protein